MQIPGTSALHLNSVVHPGTRSSTRVTESSRPVARNPGMEPSTSRTRSVDIRSEGDTVSQSKSQERQEPGPSDHAEKAETSAQGVTGNEAAELAQVLDRLQVAEEEAADSPDDEALKQEEGGNLSELVAAFRSRLSLGQTPKQALQPILEAFDVEGVAQFIKAGKAKKIIVMCGAGISVSAGIPDFRSPKTGLYANLQKFNLPHPQAVFELDFFRQNPKPFYLLAQELFPGRYKPTPAHYFMKLLDQKGLLLRCFTQNIDSLEKEAGLPSERVVAAHGNFDTAHCIKCGREVPQSVVREAVNAGSICICSSCGGYIKPDIVFFGENLPQLFFDRTLEDFPRADLLIVMGTSLVVHPFASLINHVKDNVPRILINRERVGEADAALSLLGRSDGFRFDNKHRDALYIGDCDEGVRVLAESLGWSEDLQALIDSAADTNGNSKQAAAL